MTIHPTGFGVHSRRSACALLMASLAIPSSVAHADTWSARSFGNDGALDWVEQFLQRPTSDFLSTTLAQGVGSRFISRFAGESIVAASEVVAASWGRPCIDFPIELIVIVANARMAMRRVSTLAQAGLNGVLGEASELRRLWSLDLQGLADWQDNLRQLLQRLQPA
jgi:hypothetical protein